MHHRGDLPVGTLQMALAKEGATILVETATFLVLAVV
jgi:hypothetical protein